MLSAKTIRSQSGVMLLEVLIALLIFALGVLGLVGLQANAVKQSSQTKYRVDATLLANELLGQMWIGNRTYAALNTAFSSEEGGAAYAAWKDKVQTELPGATACPPTVTVAEVQPLDAIVAGAAASAVGLTPSTRVTVTMFWLAPNEPSVACSKVHNVTLINEIK